MISYHETMTCSGSHACAMKSVTFSLMVHVLLNVVQSFSSNIQYTWTMQWTFCSFSVHVVAWKVRDHLP